MTIAALALAMSAAHGHESADAGAVRQLLMATFDRPESRLTVEPVVIVGRHAVAGWVQEGRGGRALLRSDHGKWRLVACAGDAFKEAGTLEQAGVAAADARSLAQALARAEAALPVEHVRKLSLFEGIQQMDHQKGH